MKKLMLMRHGEAQDPEKGQDDKHRLLTRKGRQDMARLHHILLGEGLLPQFALASDANRTQITLAEVTGGRDYEGTIELSPALYNAEAKKIIEAVQLLDDQYQTALIVAHNPGIYQAVADLVAETHHVELQNKIGVNYRSGTLTLLECPIESWADLKMHKNKLAKLFIPD